MMKKISFLLFLVLILGISTTLSGCKMELSLVGEAEFAKRVENKGLIITDVSYTPGEEGVKIKVCAMKENDGYQFEYRRFEDSNMSNTVFENFTATLEDMYENKDIKVLKRFSGKNYNSFTISSNDSEYIVTQIEDELIAMEVTNTNNVSEAESVYSYVIEGEK